MHNDFNNPIRSRIEQFHLKHTQGNEDNCVRDANGFYLYADGAYRDPHPLGILFDEPGPYEKTRYPDWKLEHMVRFWRAKREQAERNFRTLHESLVKHAKLGGNVTAEQEAQLTTLRDEVRRCQEEHEKALSARQPLVQRAQPPRPASLVNHEALGRINKIAI